MTRLYDHFWPTSYVHREGDEIMRGLGRFAADDPLNAGWVFRWGWIFARYRRNKNTGRRFFRFKLSWRMGFVEDPRDVSPFVIQVGDVSKVVMCSLRITDDELEAFEEAANKELTSRPRTLSRGRIEL